MDNVCILFPDQLGSVLTQNTEEKAKVQSTKQLQHDMEGLAAEYVRDNVQRGVIIEKRTADRVIMERRGGMLISLKGVLFSIMTARCILSRFCHILNRLTTRNVLFY